MMKRTTFPGQRGVSLIELMIGMFIGLIAVLIISQVLLVSEGQKRTASSGSDAQTAGALALYAVQRDVQTAGYGFSSFSNAVGCTINAQIGGVAVANFPSSLVPVTIKTQATRGAGAIGDSIRVLASSKTSYTVPTLLTAAYAINATSFSVTSALGFTSGDLGLVAVDAATPCWVFQVTAAPGSQSLPRADQSTQWNGAGTPAQAYAIDSIVANLGTVVDNRYEINLVNNVPTLQVSSFDLSNPNTRTVRNIQSDIVAMKAYYGRDTNAGAADGTIDTYDTTQPTTNDGWLRVSSVRLLVVARSSHYEQEQVTKAAPSWDVGTTPPTAGTGTCGSSQCVTFTDIGVSATSDVEANHYRYKVFEVIVPLRNLMWKESLT